jgi:hypothetical protein
MKFSEAGPVPAQGNIAQQVFWYTAFTTDMTKPGLPVVNADGTPKWRVAELEPLVAVPGLRGVVEYSDARLVDGDARFVRDFVSSALSRGAVAVNHVAVTGAERSASGSAGPPAPEVGELLGAPSRHRLALSKGVHLVVPRLVTRAPGLPDAAERRRLAREALPAFGHPDDEHGAAVIDALWRRQGDLFRRRTLLGQTRTAAELRSAGAVTGLSG